MLLYNNRTHIFFKYRDHKRKVATQWLSPVNVPYIDPDTNAVHEAKDLKHFPAISKLLESINSQPIINGPLDSCLVHKYASNATSCSSHADDEDLIDQSKSICTFSLGAVRTLEFF